MFQFETPILLLIFNRPDTTQKVFTIIREIKPEYLYISADGPRANHPGEASLCQKTREIVINAIDWECEVKTLFREDNLGCGKAVSDAITWFFEHVEEGIILEDDCLPDQSFFSFCHDLLEYYRFNENIFVISGNNFQKKKRGNASYYFSAYGHIWGWATWRRAWARYNFSLINIDNNEFNECLKLYFKTKYELEYWEEKFNTMKFNPIDTWDYQWSFTHWLNKGLNILPNVNLVTNIGFDENATHTKQFNAITSELESYGINKIIHPKKIEINRKADLFTFNKVFSYKQSLIDQLRGKARSIFGYAKRCIKNKQKPIKEYLNSFHHN